MSVKKNLENLSATMLNHNPAHLGPDELDIVPSSLQPIRIISLPLKKKYRASSREYEAQALQLRGRIRAYRHVLLPPYQFITTIICKVSPIRDFPNKSITAVGIEKIDRRGEDERKNATILTKYFYPKMRELGVLDGFFIFIYF
jgi:hypothetical protein